jgi:riboflavin kinase/FMN adenylyltransferase
MLVVTRDQRYAPPVGRAVVATIGNFDGLHRGHRRIMDTLLDRAMRLDGTSVVLSFDPHPLAVVAPDQAPRLILTRDQKLRLLEGWGLDAVVFLPFDRDMARWSAVDFVDRILVGQARVRELFVGTGFRFGHRRAAGIEELGLLGRQRGFRAATVPVVMDGEERISASRIRAAITQGQVEDAGRLLGRTYTLIGQVVPGAGRGRGLSFPTANLDPWNEILPARGVYITCLSLSTGDHFGLTNVGVRPTFGEERLIVETYLPGFDGDLYGEQVEVAFHARLREERTFSSPAALQAQIQNDLEVLEQFLARPGPGTTPPD